MTQEYRDGEDASVTIDPSTGVVNSLLLLGLGDAGMSKNGDSCRVNSVQWNGVISPYETANQSGQIDWLYWIASMSQREATDWVTNSRDPNDAALAGIASAHPYRIHKVGLVSMRADKNNVTSLSYPAAWQARMNLSLRRPVVLKFPEQLWAFFKPVTIDNFSGTWSTGEVSLTWHMKLRLQEQNQG